MAWFDVGAGLAEMGKNVAQTASVALLETYKSDLDKDRMKLANEMAMERESKGRLEQHGLDMQKLDKTQTFTAGENALNRASEEKRTAMSAGASVAAAQINAASHLTGIQKQIDALSDVRSLEVQKGKLDNLLKQGMYDARTELQSAMQSGDPTKINAAKSKVAAFEYSAQDDVKNATLLQSATRMKETELQNAETGLLKLQGQLNDLRKNATTALTADGKQAIASMEAMIAQQQTKIAKAKAEADALARQFEEAVKGLPTFSGGASTGAPDLTAYMPGGNKAGGPR